MSGISSGVWIVLFIFYFIFLWIINHKLFTFIYFDLGRGLLKEFLTYFILALILTAVTIAVWWLADIILAIIGLIAISKCDTKGKKIAVAIVLGVLMLAIAITGIKINNEAKRKDAKEKEHIETVNNDSYDATEYSKVDESNDVIEYFQVDVPQNAEQEVLKISSGNYIVKGYDSPGKLMKLTVSSDNVISGTIIYWESNIEYTIAPQKYIPGDYPIKGTITHGSDKSEYEMEPLANDTIYLSVVSADMPRDQNLTDYYYSTDIQEIETVSEDPLIENQYNPSLDDSLSIQNIEGHWTGESLNESIDVVKSNDKYNVTYQYKVGHEYGSTFMTCNFEDGIFTYNDGTEIYGSLLKEEEIVAQNLSGFLLVCGGEDVDYYFNQYRNHATLFYKDYESEQGPYLIWVENPTNNVNNIENKNISDYIIPDSSTRYLIEDELQNYTYEELRLAINEIYAKHGRIFTDPELADYFASKEWYNPTISADSFDDSVFNEYEKENLKLLANVKESKAN